MIPLAPARLSTTTCWPNDSPNFCPMSRAMMSFEPPGANGTMSRMGLTGYAWLSAARPCPMHAIQAAHPTSEASGTCTMEKRCDSNLIVHSQSRSADCRCSYPSQQHRAKHAFVVLVALTSALEYVCALPTRTVLFIRDHRSKATHSV